MPKRPKAPGSHDERLQSYVTRCEGLIAEHGHMVQSVFPGSRTPGWAYTIGLSTAGTAELLVIGLPPDTATYVLNSVAKRLATTPIADGVDMLELTNMPLRLRTLNADEVWPRMLVGRLVLQTPPREVRQVMWPDPAGRFPGDPAYRFAVLQSVDEIDFQPTSH
jgi:hypothetical protein